MQRRISFTRHGFERGNLDLLRRVACAARYARCSLSGAVFFCVVGFCRKVRVITVASIEANLGGYFSVSWVFRLVASQARAVLFVCALVSVWAFIPRYVLQ